PREQFLGTCECEGAGQRLLNFVSTARNHGSDFDVRGLQQRRMKVAAGKSETDDACASHAASLTELRRELNRIAPRAYCRALRALAFELSIVELALNRAAHREKNFMLAVKVDWYGRVAREFERDIMQIRSAPSIGIVCGARKLWFSRRFCARHVLQ